MLVLLVCGSMEGGHADEAVENCLIIWLSHRALSILSFNTLPEASWQAGLALLRGRRSTRRFYSRASEASRNRAPHCFVGRRPASCVNTLDGSATRRSGIDGSVRAWNVSDYA